MGTTTLPKIKSHKCAAFYSALGIYHVETSKLCSYEILMMPNSCTDKHPHMKKQTNKKKLGAFYACMFFFCSE